MGNYSTVIDSHGKTVQASVAYNGKDNVVSNIIIQAPEELYETEENVAYVPPKSVWINRDGAEKIRDFLNDMFDNYEGEKAEASNNNKEESLSPEERVKNYITGLESVQDTGYSDEFKQKAKSMAVASRNILDILGITIEGVND